MHKIILRCLAATLLIAGGIALGLAWGAAQPPQPEQSSAAHLHAGLALEQVRSLSALVTLRAQVADVQVTELHGHSGGITAVLLVKGDFSLATDLAQGRFESLDETHHTAVLALPPPQLLSPRADHARTRVVGVWRYGLWEVVPGEKPEAAVVNRAYAEAQRAIETAGHDPSLGQRARSQAESGLERFFDALGWKVRVRWTDTL
ncbi:MAG: hypothetical protein JWL69_1853 [Phycisphaerales bacterium]|nr:hypothetical protein [Phycisphaerales bacterium]